MTLQTDFVATLLSTMTNMTMTDMISRTPKIYFSFYEVVHQYTFLTGAQSPLLCPPSQKVCPPLVYIVY